MRGHNPKCLHEAKYGTFKERKIDRVKHFDPQPPSLRHTSSDSHINCYIQNLQAIAKKKKKKKKAHNLEPCMLQTSLIL